VGHGWCVLVGGCHRHGGQEPYSPLLDALAQHLQAQPAERQRVVLAGCAWLVRLLPELAPLLEPLPATPLPAEQEQRLLFAAVSRLLANVAGSAGTLLVLDDLQWAGQDALDLVAALVRRAQAVPVPLRIVGAYRDTEVRPNDPLGHLRADLAQAGLLRHSPLAPLAPSDAAALLANLLAGGTAQAPGDASLVARVLERAGGVPFFLVSYAQALRAAQGPGATPQGPDAVPWDVAQGVRQRVALLPEPARQLLSVAAIVGRHVPWPLLVAVSGQPEDTVLAGLEAAGQARLLIEGETYAFAHDVIREVVEADIGPARRAVLHRKVAQALERDAAGASPEVLAYHYVRGGDQDKAVLYLEQAGDHALAQRAHGAAERQYREALERVERLGRPRDAVRLREKLGEVLKWTGRYADALEILEAAAEHFRQAGDQEGLGRVAANIGNVYAFRGTADEGIARLRLLLAQLGDGASASMATLHACVGLLLFLSNQYDESLVACERAVELARASGDDRTLVQARWQRANLLQMLGRLDEALQADCEVLAGAEALGDLECLVAVPRDMAYIHALQGAFAVGRHRIDQSVALAEQMGNPAQISFSLTIRAWLATLEGDWQRAHADLDQAETASRQVDRSWHSSYPPIFRAFLSLAEDDRPPATASVQEALTLAEESGDLQALRWASAVMAEIDIVEGRPEAARARLLPLLDRPGLEECDVTTLLPVLAWAQLELGEVDPAAATVEQALARARPEEMRLALVELLRVQALIALRRDQWDEAARGLEEGLRLARDMPYPYAEARLLQVYGALHAQKQEPVSARERLEAAHAIFQRLGARKDAERTERELVALG
jgi:tetratricopeptide (TPR) repeat protein